MQSGRHDGTVGCHAEPDRLEHRTDGPGVECGAQQRRHTCGAQRQRGGCRQVLGARIDHALVHDEARAGERQQLDEASDAVVDAERVDAAFEASRGLAP